MSPVLVAFVGVLLVPLFVASWRLSLFGLAVQGLLMAWISYQQDPALSAPSAWVGLFDLVVVRAIGAPLALYAVLRAQRATARNDLQAPNLMSWALAVALVLVAFRFADLLVPLEGDERSFVVGAAAGLLLGLLVLATQTGPFSQMVGALRIENAIALFELGGHHVLGLQIAQTLLLIAMIALFRWYLKTLPRPRAAKLSALDGMSL